METRREGARVGSEKNSYEKCEQDVVLRVETTDSTFSCEVVSGASQDAQYAFYLNRGQERAGTIWYSPKNRAEFEINTNGVYTIAAFIKEGEKPKVISTEAACFSKVTSCEFDFSGKCVDIFGSCVSRDLIEVNKSKNFELGTYIARESIVSMLSSPIEYEKESIKLASAFQARMLELDLSKEGLKKLEENHSQYLIIDLIDERFDLGKVGDSYFTISNEFLESDVLDKCQYEVLKKNEGFEKKLDKTIERYVESFCERLLAIYEPQNIVLHKAFMVDYYKDKEQRIKKFSFSYLNYNKRINKILGQMYGYIEKYIPEAIVIDVCNEFCADENHKWGLAPKHYQQEYYVTVLNEIYKKILMANE